MNEERKEKFKLRHWWVIAIMLMIYDVIAINFSYFFGLWIRFDFIYSHIPLEYLRAYLHIIPWYSVITVILFWFLRMYRGVWRFSGLRELIRYTIASLCASVIHCVVITIFFDRMPASYYIIGTVMQVLLLVGARFSYRFYCEVLAPSKFKQPLQDASVVPVMIIGAGAAGRTVVRELLSSERLRTRPCCFIDDNNNKWNRFVDGIPVVGGRESIPDAVKKYNVEQIYFCIPTASPQERKEILEICKGTGCQMKRLPGIYQLVNGDVLVSRLRPVALEDLLGREPIRVDMQEIFQQLRGKRILVTGGGGSIGSELCRQIADHEPEMLIIFDIYENNAYEIQQELKRKHPDLNLLILIGSVRDSRRLENIFEMYKPQLVFHAAAHKHVPLMEDSPNEAIKNNVMGTYKTAKAALKFGAERFVLISTDKAVNPTSIMGASKRICEMVIQSMDVISRSGDWDKLPELTAKHGNEDHSAGIALDGEWEDLEFCSVSNEERTSTQFVAVRFGNVLGSNGSVVPLFQKQIEEGGPVTVTHPEITRFFMTIPEAVSLILQSATYALGGEIFVLDMGDPVKIDVLARNLIQLSGFRPDEDIKIEYTGLRPGEKLYEEKLMAEEGLKQTENKLIFIGQPIPFEIDKFLGQLAELNQACYENSDRIVELVEEIVPTFHPVGAEPEKVLEPV